MCFCTFPLAVFGSSSGTPSSPTNQTHAGAFWCQGQSTVSAHRTITADSEAGQNTVNRTYLRIHALRHHASRLLFGHSSGRLPHNPRTDDFPVFRIWDRNHSGLSNLRVCRHDVFNLDGE